MDNIIQQKIKELRKQKKLNQLNSESEKNYINQQIQAEKNKETNAKKQEVKQEIVNETKFLCKNVFNFLKKSGIITTKQAYSDCMGKSPNYWLMIECRENQAVSVTALKELKENLYQIKYNLDLLMIDEDNNLKLWVKNKLEFYIEQIEQEIMKIMRVIYGIRY